MSEPRESSSPLYPQEVASDQSPIWQALDVNRQEFRTEKAPGCGRGSPSAHLHERPSWPCLAACNIGRHWCGPRSPERHKQTSTWTHDCHSAPQVEKLNRRRTGRGGRPGWECRSTVSRSSGRRRSSDRNCLVIGVVELGGRSRSQTRPLLASRN